MILNGAWQGEYVTEKGERVAFPATVPGCIHTDLQACGKIGDFYYRDESKTVQWIENCDVSYSRDFDVPEPSSSAFLEFDGLDTYCDIFLNGQKIGDAHNMFVPRAYPVDGVLKRGANRLEVRFRSPIREVAGKPKLPGAFTTERLHTRRVQCTYGWDWVDRFVTMGIYRDVRLVFRRPNTVAGVYVTTEEILPGSAQIKVAVDLSDFQNNGDRLSFSVADPGGNVVFAKSRTLLDPTVEEWIDIPGARLWYPNGYGEQPLYTLTVSTPAGETSVVFGVRRITLRQLVDQPGSPESERCKQIRSQPFAKGKDNNETTSGFTVFVNGTPVFCKGADWVPCEPFPSAETPEKITKILETSRACGVNMIRVWGGGIFERDEFYSTCDRLGILVAQDFLMACGTYPENEEWFLDELKLEARAGALRLRNHACLAFWNGDNENAVHGNENRTDFPGYLAAKVIAPILAELDPARRFLPSSPYGGDPYCSPTRGTAHSTFFLGAFFRYVRENDLSDWRETMSQYLTRFNAEQPTMGMPFVSTLRRFLSDEDIFGDDQSMSEFHTKTNPSIKELTLFGHLDKMTEKLFGKYESGEDRVAKMQQMHCEWVRLGVELYRRNKWFASGILFWMLNDCWPAANSWSLIDYYGVAKPAFYAFKRCAKPVLASIAKCGNQLTVTVSNDGLAPVSGKGRLALYDFGEEKDYLPTEFTYTVPANASATVLSLDYKPFADRFTRTRLPLCDIANEDGSTDRAFFVPARYADLDLTYRPLRVIADTPDSVTVQADAFSPFALLDSPDLLSDNAICMKKGETRVLKRL